MRRSEVCVRTLSLGLMLALYSVVGSSATLASPATEAKPVSEDRYPERRTSFPHGVIGIADLTYATLPGFRPLRLDLYRPEKTSGVHPLVIYIHGGGWVSGHTRHAGAFQNWPGVLADLAARGYVVSSIEYRLSGEARFPAAIQDVKAAIRWLRAHAAEYSIDPQQVVVWGGSAGGQLAALAATTCGVAGLEPESTSSPTAAPSAPAISDCVQGVVAWYGIFDLATIAAASGGGAQQSVGSANSAPSRYLGCPLSSCSRETLAAASASAYIDAKDPPVLLIHGVGDKTVPIQQSRDFDAKLRAQGVKVELLEIPAVDHSFIGASAEITRQASLQALNRTISFIDATTGHARAP